MSERALLGTFQQCTIHHQRETLQHNLWSTGKETLLPNDTFIVSFTVAHLEAGTTIFPLISLRNLRDGTASVSKELGYFIFREYQ